MDGISEKLSQLLNDPAALEKVRELANNFMNDTDIPKPEPDIDINRLMSVISAVKNAEESENEKLLYALKPHLCAERCEKVDKAVKILRLVNLLPLLKDSGLLDL